METGEQSSSFYTFSIFDLIHLIRVRFVLIAVLVVAATVGAVVSNGMRKPVYRSTLFLQPNTSVLSSPEVEAILERFETMVKQGRHNKLAQELGMPVEKAGALVAFDVDTPRKFKDTIVSVRFDVYEPELLPALRDGVLEYLEANPLIQTNVVKRRDSLKESYDLLDARLEQINDLLPDSSIAGTTLSIEDLYYITDLELKKADIQLKLDQRSGVLVVSEPIIPRKPFSPPGNMIVGVSAAVGGFILGLIIAMLLEVRRHWREGR